MPFYEICRYTDYNDWPRNKDDIFREEQVRCQRMRDFVESLGDGWFLFRYEEMVDKKFDALNAYLGFQIGVDTGVPSGTGKEKAVRKKAYEVSMKLDRPGKYFWLSFFLLTPCTD